MALLPFGLALVASAWIALVIAAPIAPPPLAAIVYAFGSLICHQIPERSFHLAASQLPVCARCAGIYAGAAMAAVSVVVLSPDAAAVRFVLRRARTIMAMASVPTLVTLVFEWSGLWQPSNGARSIAGIALGLGAAAIVIGTLRALHYGRCEPRRRNEPSQQRTPI